MKSPVEGNCVKLLWWNPAVISTLWAELTEMASSALDLMFLAC